MILLFYAALNVLAVLLFISIRKTLHVIETMVYWMTASYLFQNFSALCYMNLKTLMIPEKLGLELSHFLNRIVLFPLLMTAFLHQYISLTSARKKLLFIILYTALLTGLEWLADFLDVLIHVHWRFWWSLLFWWITLLILIGIAKLFRLILYRGDFEG